MKFKKLSIYKYTHGLIYCANIVEDVSYFIFDWNKSNSILSGEFFSKCEILSTLNDELA